MPWLSTMMLSVMTACISTGVGVPSCVWQKIASSLQRKMKFRCARK